MKKKLSILATVVYIATIILFSTTSVPISKNLVADIPVIIPPIFKIMEIKASPNDINIKIFPKGTIKTV